MTHQLPWLLLPDCLPQSLPSHNSLGIQTLVTVLSRIPSALKKQCPDLRARLREFPLPAWRKTHALREGSWSEGGAQGRWGGEKMERRRRRGKGELVLCIPHSSIHQSLSCRWDSQHTLHRLAPFSTFPLSASALSLSLYLHSLSLSLTLFLLLPPPLRSLFSLYSPFLKEKKRNN